MAKTCCVCSDSKESAENRLFRCGGQGCGITVHQACYGIVTIPSGFWFCRKCESQERAARVKCELCPRKDGALKRTDAGSWAHVVCALYIPEVTFGNLRTMEPIITSKLPRERFTKTCYICEGLGQENQASTGACMSCHKSNCRLSFHVTCAQREQLLVEEEDSRDSRNIIYCGYCSAHYKRMMKQKLKQNVKKQGVPVSGEEGGGGIPLEIVVGGVGNIQPRSHSENPRDSSTSHSNVHQKHLSKLKETERLSKRSSSDVGLAPSVKRKYRRRKLSSSNDSSTSEAPSNISENVLQNMPASPSTASIHSPGSFSGGKKSGIEDVTDQGVHGGEMDCGNLDLLASVTQHVNQVDSLTEPRTEMPPFPPVYTSSEVVVSQTTNAPPLSVSHSTETVSRESGKRTTGGGGGGKGAVRKRKSTTSASTNQKSSTNNSSQLGPPLSLQELLERQWEQTAQFILDQAGKQNNAGVMLAHLHELQSENRSMQSRIMELASQREFFIATNSRLRQTLTEGGINRVLNGIQLLSSDGGQSFLANHTTPGHPLGPSSGHTRSHSNAMEVDHHRIVTSTTTTTRKLESNPHISSSSVQFSNPVLPDRVSNPNQRHTHVAVSYSSSSFSSSSSVTSYPIPNESENKDSHSCIPSGVHEVTHVTNSVQGPIVAYTGFPDAHSPSTPPHRHST